MSGPSSVVRVMVATRPVDFHRGVDGLAAPVREATGPDLFSGTIWVFRSKRADRIKFLFWGGSGVVPAAKSLENGKFCWPEIEDDVVRLSAAQLLASLERLDWERVHEARQVSTPQWQAEQKGWPTGFVAHLPLYQQERDRSARRRLHLHARPHGRTTDRASVRVCRRAPRR